MGNQQGTDNISGVTSTWSESLDAQSKRLKEGIAIWAERCNTPGYLTKEAFEGSLFPAAPFYGGVLFNFMCGDESVAATCKLTTERYMEAGVCVLQPPNSSQLDLFFKIFFGSKACVDKSEVLVMMNACHDMMRSVVRLDTAQSPRNDAVFTAVLKSLFGQNDKLSQAEFSYWFRRHCQQLFDGIYQVTCSTFIGDKTVNSQSAGADSISFASEVGHQVATGNSLLSSALLWLLTSSLPRSYVPACGGDEAAYATLHLPMIQVCSPAGWHLLYDSNEQGLSVTRFQHHVFEYKGATLTFITFSGHVYCVGSDSEWREGTQRFGGCDTCLVHIHPEYSVMQTGADMLYVNFSDRTAPRGIQFGKDIRTTFLSIDEGLSRVTHYGIPTDLHRLQVWGCAGPSTREAQMKQKDWEKKQVMKSKDRKIKLDDWKNNPDRQLLEMGGMTTQHAQR